MMRLSGKRAEQASRDIPAARLAQPHPMTHLSRSADSRPRRSLSLSDVYLRSSRRAPGCIFAARLLLIMFLFGARAALALVTS